MFNDKIIAYHLLTRPEDQRERNSIASVGRISDIPNVTYNKIINKPYTKRPPSNGCVYSERISMTGAPDNKGSKLTPGTYGCYMAHRDCILSITPHDDEIYLFFEADAKLLVFPNIFINVVHFSKSIMLENDLHIFSLGKFGYHADMKWSKKTTHIESDSMYGTHCYMLLKEGVEHLQNAFKTKGWQAYDFWLREQCGVKTGFFYDAVCNTFEGESLISRQF
jgi:hypothetical protein